MGQRLAPHGNPLSRGVRKPFRTGRTAGTNLVFVILWHVDRGRHMLAFMRSAAIRRLRNLPLVVLLSQFPGTNLTPVNGKPASLAARNSSRRQAVATASSLTAGSLSITATI